MPIIELIIYFLSLVLVFAGIFRIHLKLRSRSSLALVVSFSLLVIFFIFAQFYREHLLSTTEYNVFLNSTTETVPETAALTNEQNANITAEAFSKMPQHTSLDGGGFTEPCFSFGTISRFDKISTVVLLILLFATCTAFFISTSRSRV